MLRLFNPFRLLRSVRTLLFLGLLGASVGVPYAATRGGDLRGSLSTMWNRVAGRVAKLAPAPHDPQWNDVATREARLGPARPEEAPRLKPDLAPLEGMPATSLEDVLRFDITPNWVYGRWSRKSTGLAELNFHGIRVPLVTGTGVDDLAGSLTYYFSPEGRAERIDFRGRTGDAHKLVTLVMRRFAFRPQRPTVAGEQLYEVRWNDKAMGRLRIKPASVIWASSPHASFDVDLVLQRPGTPYYVPQPQAALPTASDTSY